MSWNSYIENLQASGSVKKAAICGHDGSQWAASEGFSVTPDEAKNLVAAFTNSSTLTMSGNDLPRPLLYSPPPVSLLLA